MATQRTVKQRARALQAQAKERGENLPYTAALRMADTHEGTTSLPDRPTFAQVLQSLFTEDYQLFISASDDAERLKAEGLDEIFEDEEVEAFTINQGNVYEAIINEWSLYGTPIQVMSVYGYTDENDLSNLKEYRLVDVWWEIGQIQKLVDEFDNKVTATFTKNENATEATASYILTELERFDMVDLLAEILGDALKIDNPMFFEDMLGDASEMLSLEFMALLARPYIGKHEGWTQETYHKIVAFWNENFDTPVHPEDKQEEPGKELAPDSNLSDTSHEPTPYYKGLYESVRDGKTPISELSNDAQYAFERWNSAHVEHSDDATPDNDPYPYGVVFDPVITCDADRYEIDLVNAGEQGRPRRIIVPKTVEQLHSIMRVNHLWNVQQRKAHGVRVRPEHHQRIVNVFLKVGDVVRFYGERMGKYHTKYIVRAVDPTGRYIFCNTTSENRYIIIDLHTGVRGAHDSYGYGGATEQAGEVIEALTVERIHLSDRRTVLLDIVSVHRGEVAVL